MKITAFITIIIISTLLIASGSKGFTIDHSSFWSNLLLANGVAMALTLSIHGWISDLIDTMNYNNRRKKEEKKRKAEWDKGKPVREAREIKRKTERLKAEALKERVNILFDNKHVAVAGVLGATAGAGTSIAMDVVEANAIFNAAREANSNLGFMSNDAIISHLSGLSDAEMMGHVNLVHGRYFENLVAESTGGTLFEAKNHPETDMILEDVEYSIKANDATADAITSFETYSPQDLGLDGKELHERTAEVMDGDIVDIMDAVASGTIGAGTIATATAIYTSAEEWEKLSDYQKTKVKAACVVAKGTGRAGRDTAKGLWGATKLLGKGLSKGYAAHKKFKHEGGYEKLQEEMRKL